MASGTENNPPSCEIPIIESGIDYSKPMDVVFWYSFLSSLYQSSVEMQASRVLRLNWYKYAGGVEHEYVLATVMCGGREFYLRIERRASSDRVVNENNVLKQEIIDTFPPECRTRFLKDISLEKNAVRSRKWTGSSSKSSSSKNNIPRADDSVTQVLSSKGITGDDGGEVHLLASYDFSSSKPLYLRDLAFIMQHINKSSVGYTLLMEQCYWFTRTCIGVAKYRCEPEEICTAHRSHAGTYWVAKFEALRLRSQVSRLAINKDDLPQVEKFAQAVDANIRVNDEYLTKKYSNGEGGRLQAEQDAKEAQQAAEEARQAAEEAQQAAEEERRQKAQETHRAELAEKVVEQLRAQLALLQTNPMSPKAHQ